jgi:hypothetical protein
MSDLQPYPSGEVNSGPARRAARAISRHRLDAHVRVAAIDADTDTALAKIDNVTMSTGSAMSAVVRIAQAQRHLEQLAPEAAGRLAYLADDHMLGVGEILTDLRRDLRRR